MKAIMVMFDTLNRHMLPPYGCDWTHAPNFARLAQRTVTFDQSYVGSMPCMPARRELHTGRYNFLHRSWGPLEPFDDSLPELLQKQGVYTHLATDHQHYFEDGGATYHTRYNTWEFVRGQEGDAWKGQVNDPEIPDALRPSHTPLWRQDWVNRAHMTTEEAQPQAQTFSLGLDFIRTNASADNWFLQIETFDPHEPFFTQQQYKDLYPHDYDGPHFDWPSYRQVSESAEEVAHLRYQYAALLSMCDHYLGKVLDLMDELNLWDDTLLIVNTDHGFLLGEHDWWAKIVQPFYQEVAHTPLFIWDPRCRCQGERRDGLVQMIDIAPTVLDYFGVTIPADMQGVPLKEAIADNVRVRDAALFGVHGGHVNVTDGRYVYMRAPAQAVNEPLYNYTLMPTHMRSRFALDELRQIEAVGPLPFTKNCQVMKLKANPAVNAHQFGTLLWDVVNDPGQQTPLHDPEVEQRMLDLMTGLMVASDAPEEQFTRLGLAVPVK